MVLSSINTICKIHKMKKEKTLDEIYKEEKRAENQTKNAWKKLLRGTINVSGLFKHLDDNTYWWPEDIVDIELTDKYEPGYRKYQHARVVNDKHNRLYMKMPEDEIRSVDHYYVWQTCGYMGDDYSGWMLFPLKNGKYFRVYYNC